MKAKEPAYAHKTSYYQNKSLLWKAVFWFGYLGWLNGVFWIVRIIQAWNYRDMKKRMVLYAKTYFLFGLIYLLIFAVAIYAEFR